MYDRDLAREILRQVLWSARTVLRRFAPVESPADLLASDAGLEKLDALCMQLIAIGESVKHLDKVTHGRLLSHYPEIEWKRVMGMRDNLTHHYFDIDAEVVYATCASDIRPLATTVERILEDIS